MSKTLVKYDYEARTGAGNYNPMKFTTTVPDEGEVFAVGAGNYGDITNNKIGVIKDGKAYIIDVADIAEKSDPKMKSMGGKYEVTAGLDMLKNLGVDVNKLISNLKTGGSDPSNWQVGLSRYLPDSLKTAGITTENVTDMNKAATLLNNPTNKYTAGGKFNMTTSAVATDEEAKQAGLSGYKTGTWNEINSAATAKGLADTQAAGIDTNPTGFAGSTVNAATANTTGWVDPATGQQTPAGTGQQLSEYQKTHPEAGNTGGNPQGYLPGYKGVYKGKENLMANQNAVNELFKQYHGRDATAQEVQYWSQKKVGDLEDTLAKTTIFSKEDADKIRAQMMTQGLTYIPNQAELEKLGSGAGVTLPQGAGSMLFQPTNTGASGSGAGTGTGSGTGSGTGTGAGTGTGTGTGDPTDALADTVADAVGDPNAGEDEILSALEKIKTGQIDPYYKQLISQAQQDITTSINRSYEDRIRQLQSESFNLSENIQNTQKSLSSKGLTFSGEAIKQLGTLSAFAQGTPAGLTPTQLGQDGQPLGGNVVPGQTLPAPATGLPTMTAEQMGLEGSTNLANRLTAESTRSKFNQGLEDIGTSALRLLGSQGVTGLGLPANAGATPTTGTMQYDYNKTLQNLYGNLSNQEGDLTNYQGTFL